MNKPTAFAQLFKTEKFIVSVCVDSYHGLLASVSGWHAFAPEPVTLTWIGENMRKSLLTSKHQRFAPEDFDRDAFELANLAAQRKFLKLRKSLKKEFHYRSPDTVFKKAVLAYVSWPHDNSEPIEIHASNRKRGGMYEGYANERKYANKVRYVPMESNDLELGLAAREVLAESTISGKPVEM